jgi:hypothetical protein
MCDQNSSLLHEVDDVEFDHDEIDVLRMKILLSSLLLISQRLFASWFRGDRCGLCGAGSTPSFRVMSATSQLPCLVPEWTLTLASARAA